MSNYEEHLRISGGILKEVSEKLPNMYVALNELVKNSYDACAKNVEIIFSSESHSLIIRDDGSGMNKNGISTLLSVSRSKKKYGSKNSCGRIVQGSKGLGFLSVFKFGKKAYWESVADGVKRSFSMDISEIEREDNASEKKFQVTEDEVDNIDTYTLIRIETTKKEEKEFLDTFRNPEKAEKLLNSFSDNSMAINLNIDNSLVSSTSDINSYNLKLADKVIYTVSYNSNREELIFKHNGKELFTTDFKFKSKKFTLQMELTIYHLRGSSVEESDPLFIFRTSNERFLAPLVYINNNLFQSHELFNPSITRPIRSAIVLSQIAGVINIYSSDNGLEFNAERTKLVDNAFSNELIQFLQDINIEIQTKGSENKFGLTNYNKIIMNHPENIDPLPGDTYEENIESIKRFCVNSLFKHTDKLNTDIKGNKITFSFLGEKLGTYTLPKLQKDLTYPVEIKLIKDFDVFNVPSQQIDLMSYVESAKDSKLNGILDELEVFVDRVKSDTKILGGINNQKEIEVVFRYNDQYTGPHSQPLLLKFEKKQRQFQTTAEASQLIQNYAKESYSISYNYYVSKLIEQINHLYQNGSIEMNNIIEVIACSLRAIFDLSIEAIKSLSIKPDKIKDGSLESNVNKVIEICHVKSIREKIASNTGISNEILKNKLLINDGTKPTKVFGDIVRKANLATHTSTKHISQNDIEDISKHIAFFVIFVNEIINNEDIRNSLEV